MKFQKYAIPDHVKNNNQQCYKMGDIIFRCVKDSLFRNIGDIDLFNDHGVSDMYIGYFQLGGTIIYHIEEPNPHFIIIKINDIGKDKIYIELDPSRLRYYFN